MNWFEKWMLKRILRKTVVQGGHKERINNIYSMIISAAQEQFTEDNNPTLRSFLEECQHDALNKEL